MPSVIKRQVYIHRDHPPVNCPGRIAFVRHRREASLSLVCVVSALTLLGVLVTSKRNISSLSGSGHDDSVSFGSRSKRHAVDLFPPEDVLGYKMNTTHHVYHKQTHHKKKAHKTHKSVKPQSFITVDFSPNYGTNMFEYATLLAIANRTERTPIIPHNFRLLNAYYLSAGQDKRISHDNTLHFQHHNLNHIYRPQPETFVLPTKPANVRLHGLLKSWKYFQHIDSRIHQEYHISSANEEKGKTLLRKITNSTIPVQVITVAFGWHTVPSKHMTTYLTRAFDYFEDRFENNHFVLVCHDIKSCKKTASLLSKKHRISIMKFTSTSTFMSVMQASDHGILGVISDLTWWACWYNHGIVLYDKDFADELQDSTTKLVLHGPSFFMPHWIYV